MCFVIICKLAIKVGLISQELASICCEVEF